MEKKIVYSCLTPSGENFFFEILKSVPKRGYRPRRIRKK